MTDTTNPQADEPEDTCRLVDIDGETIRVHGSSEMDDESRAALADVIAAAKRKYASDHPPVEVADPERRERYAAALYATLEVSPVRHPWGTLSPLRRAVWYARADAAMRLADGELAAATVPASAPAEQAALRDRIAEALSRAPAKERRADWTAPNGPLEITARVGDLAAAVLAVLPAPADRAALLRETADAYDAIINKSTGKEADPRYWSGVHDVAVGLRAMADAVPVSGPGGAADETRAEPVDRAAIEAAALRNAADRYATLADQNEAYDREHGDLDEAARIQHGTVRDVAIGLRRMADEAQQSTSCSARPCNPAADELCDAHAQIRYHAEGEHAFCGPECTEEPSS